MNPHALTVLEFARSLEAVGARAGNRLGREHVEGLTPQTDPEWIRTELARVVEVQWLLDAEPHWVPPPFPDAETALEHLEPEGAVLGPEELLVALRLLVACREVSEHIDQLVDAEGFQRSVEAGTRDPVAQERPHLAQLRSQLPVAVVLEEHLSRIVDEEGGIRDDASSELRRIRDRIRSLKGTVVHRLEVYMEALPEAYRVADASVSVRDGRYVVPIRREGKSHVGGIIRGESATGATLFVEPPIAIELMNELHGLEQEEAREVHRLLRRGTERLAPLRDELLEGFRAQIELDSLSARARAARDWGAAVPEMLADVEEADALCVRGGRHPLLIEKGLEVIPFSLELEEDERVVVVSGPNTGGKTVLLKALGLTHALAQSGVLPPVAEGTRLPVLTQIFADIGDEQSIAESLSTFSAHVANSKRILAESGRGTLVLLDELGTGTDPTEGAALARVTLEALVDSGARAVVTSHLGALKRLDVEGSGIVNASLLFDGEELAPTFELKKGRPGRSFGLAIARRLGFPETLLDRAERYVGSEELRLDRLLETLDEKERELARALEEAHAAGVEARQRRAEVEARQADLEEREHELETHARERARSLLLEAREEVEAVIRDLHSSEDEDTQAAAARARRRVERAAEVQRHAAPTRPHRSRGGREPVRVGGRARILASGTVGVVREIREERVALDVGGVRMRVAKGEVESIGEIGDEEPGTLETGHIPTWTSTSIEPSHEIDLRGLRVDEVDVPLGRALDGAVVGNLSELRIIHGMGTGAVKARVREVLEREKHVRSFRSGGPGEGGAGVTVAVLH